MLAKIYSLNKYKQQKRPNFTKLKQIHSENTSTQLEKMFVPLPQVNNFGATFESLCDKRKQSFCAQQASAGAGCGELNQHGAQHADTKIPFMGHNHLDKMCCLWSLLHMCKWCTQCPSSDGDDCGAGCKPIIEGSHHSGDSSTNNNPTINGLGSQMLDIPLPLWFILSPSLRTFPGSTLDGRWSIRLFLTSPCLTPWRKNIIRG